jgi:DNA-binding NtrC family response regulator
LSQSKSVLVIDDEAGMRDLISRAFSEAGYRTAAAPDGIVGVKAVQDDEFDVVLLDMSLPKMNGLEALNRIKEIRPHVPVIMITAYGSVKTAVEALRLGAYDYITKPFELDELQVLVERALAHQHVIDENSFLRNELKSKYGFDNIVGTNRAVQKAYVMAAQVAQTDATVLILGETGTGKEYLARTIHYQSKRADGPFIKVNCAALPETLLESELFGHEKGAFTHAVSKHIGRFETSDGGTILLDEIGDITAAVQAKLLRVLQEKQFERIGGSETITVDTRVIAATNRNLEKALQDKDFREDLYYRLNVITLKLPPLRERPDDIVVFAQHFLKAFTEETGKRIKTFSDEAMALLKGQAWPGNIRELENAIERAVILCNGETIRPEHLLLGDPSEPAAGESTGNGDVPVTASLRDVEMIHINRVLESKHWNQSAAAAQLGIDRKTLRSKVREFKLEKPEG